MESELKTYATWLRAHGLGDRTVERYRQGVRLWLEWSADRAIDVALLHEYRRYLQKEHLCQDGSRGLRPRSIRPILSSLWMYLEQLESQGVTGLPKRGCVKAPPLDRALRVKPTGDEVRRFWDAARGLPAHNLPARRRRDQAVAVLGILCYAGLRNNELRDLDVADVHLEKRQLHIRAGKGEKAEWVPISEELHGYLVTWLATRAEWLRRRAVQPEIERALFPVDARRRMDEGSLTALINILNSAAGQPADRRITPHCLRHWFASTMAKNGVPLARISRLLRHARRETTFNYLYDDEEGMDESVAVIGKALAETPAEKPAPVRSPETRGEGRSYPPGRDRRSWLARRSAAGTPPPAGGN
jgi:site-specific recombinase XerD